MPRELISVLQKTVIYIVESCPAGLITHSLLRLSIMTVSAILHAAQHTLD